MPSITGVARDEDDSIPSVAIIVSEGAVSVEECSGAAR